MSICSSGASTTKPGVSTSIIVDANYVKSLLPPGWEWLYDYLPYMRALAIGSTATFCSADPPTWSLPSSTDLYNFLTGGFVTQSDFVTAFLNKLTEAYLWYSICQCTTGTTPTPAAPPAPPANLPAHNPGLVVTSPSAACAHAQSLVSLDPSGTTGGNYLIPDGPFTLPTVPKYPLPVGTTTLVLTAVSIVSGAHHGGLSYHYTFFDSAGSALGTGNPVVASGATVVTTVTPPAGTVAFGSFSALSPSSFNTDGVQLTLDAYCGGALPGTQTSPCCPPDQTATGLLQQILSLVTLQQRQTAPFGYILSTAHAGLTGNGSFAVTGLLGLQVTVTAGLSAIGSEAGTPTEYFSDSFVCLGSSDGYPHCQRIEHSPQLWFPSDAGALTTVAYTLRPGLTATITEVVREP